MFFLFFNCRELFLVLGGCRLKLFVMLFKSPRRCVFISLGESIVGSYESHLCSKAMAALFLNCSQFRGQFHGVASSARASAREDRVGWGQVRVHRL